MTKYNKIDKYIKIYRLIYNISKNTYTMSLQLWVWNDPFNKAMWDILDSKEFDLSTAVALCLIELNVKLQTKWIIEEEGSYLFPNDEINNTPWEQRFEEILVSTRRKVIPLSIRSMELIKIKRGDITPQDEISWLKSNSEQVQVTLEWIHKLRGEMETIIDEITSLDLPI